MGEQWSESRNQNSESLIANSKLKTRNTKRHSLQSEVRSRSTERSRRSPKSEYGFKVSSYDKTKELIIDPLLASTYLGGTDYENSSAIALDSEGHVYVTGSTESSDFPATAGVYDISKNGRVDNFVSKLSGDLTKLMASTFLGGSYYEDDSFLAVDNYGNVYIAGSTGSSDFPTTKGAYDVSYNGTDISSFIGDAFISKLSSDLTSLIASTFLGGTNKDVSSSLSINYEGYVYVTGWTKSSDFPTIAGAYDTSYNGGGNIFASKLSSDLTELTASTYLGGDSGSGGSLVLNSDGHAYLTGLTRSH